MSTDLIQQFELDLNRNDGQMDGAAESTSLVLMEHFLSSSSEVVSHDCFPV